MPEFLAEELKDYIDSLYGVDEDDRIFPISKSYLHHEMDRGCEATGEKKIRIHDIRHSHVSVNTVSLFLRLPVPVKMVVMN